MQDFKKKRTFKRRLYSKLVLIVLLVIFIFVVRGGWDIYKKAKSSEEKLRVAEETQMELEAKKASIEAQIARLETETGIEEEIRSKFDVVRDGEQVIVIVDAETEATSTPPSPGGVRGFFTTLFSWFQ
jgi:cell division protein FtsB